jgi:hypothetical protein
MKPEAAKGTEKTSEKCRLDQEPSFRKINALDTGLHRRNG